MDRALIIRRPHIDKILSGEKIWEMRSKPTKVRGRIGLIEAGSGLIVGECEILGVGESIKNFNLGYGQHFHRVEDLSLLDKWHIPWIMGNPVRYKEPIPYDHPKGAVIWVKVDIL